MRPALPVLALAALLAGCASQDAPDPAPADASAPALATLEGTTWMLRIEPLDAGGTDAGDLLRFSGRQAALMNWEGRGYTSTGYSATPKEKEGAIAFDFQNRNAEGELLSVSGWANPLAVWGTLTWRRADWTVRTFRFRGTPKK